MASGVMAFGSSFARAGTFAGFTSNRVGAPDLSLGIRRGERGALGGVATEV